MDVFTMYVGQGALAVARHRNEAVIIDSRMPASGDVTEDEISSKLRKHLHGHSVAGLILTGFDNDHADASGVDLIFTEYEPDWVMYPKYYKDGKEATAVFRVIEKHERRRQNSPRPLHRISVRLDKLDSRFLTGLADHFTFELFSPHIEDMDNSNNCSIVLKLGTQDRTGFTYLITGDTENERWETINKLFGQALSSDVLAAPHHGSKNAAHPEMALFVDPNTVLISAGVDNQYGHPHSQAVKVYQAVANHLFTTNVHSGVSLLTEPSGADFKTTLVPY